jgi:LysM domain
MLLDQGFSGKISSYVKTSECWIVGILLARIMMKKFNTRTSRVIAIGATAALLGIGCGHSFAQNSGAPVNATSGTPASSSPVAQSNPRAKATAPLELAKDAPDKYIVVRGDTLWDISGKFLQKPWRWPEIWQLNREQIRNPHWIYPGNIVYLDMSSGQPRLRLGQASGSSESSSGNATIKLQPTARADSLRDLAIPTISSSVIAAFINRPLIVTIDQLKTSPRILATQDGRVNVGPGDLAYVRGIQGEALTDWHIYREARPILDPDTRKPIAYEALFVGSARLERVGDPATLRITGTSEEVGVGDRLIPAEIGRPFNYAPHPPDQDISGRIVSIYRGVAQVGKNSVVAVNLGAKSGLEVGHVLAIKQKGREVLDPDTKQKVRLPDEPTGYLLIFRVFDSIGYGLVTAASDAVTLGDMVANP